MSPAAISAFRARSAGVHNAAHGVPVTFRGQEVRVCLSPIAIGLDLATGGLTQGGQFNCRFLASDLSTPPKRGESVLYGGRSYLVSEIKQLIHSEAEHVCILTPGSLQ